MKNLTQHHQWPVFDKKDTPTDRQYVEQECRNPNCRHKRRWYFRSNQPQYVYGTKPCGDAPPTFPPKKEKPVAVKTAPAYRKPALFNDVRKPVEFTGDKPWEKFLAPAPAAPVVEKPAAPPAPRPPVFVGNDFPEMPPPRGIEPLLVQEPPPPVREPVREQTIDEAFTEARLKEACVFLRALYEDMIAHNVNTPARQMAGRFLYSDAHEKILRHYAR